ncbi:Uncharacterised protein [uncultured archaeon]|nr:Uncharacterised protein [uncultured archaeon]
MRLGVWVLLLLLLASAYAVDPSIQVLYGSGKQYAYSQNPNPSPFIYVKYSRGDTVYDNASCTTMFVDGAPSTWMANTTKLKDGDIAEYGFNTQFGNHTWQLQCTAYQSTNTSNVFPTPIITPLQNLELRSSACSSGAEVYGFLNIDQQLDAGAFKVQLADVSVADGEAQLHPAILNILDANDQVIGQIQVGNGDRYTFTQSSTGKTLKVIVFQTSWGLALDSRWAEVSTCYVSPYFNFSLYPNETYVREQQQVPSNTFKLTVARRNASDSNSNVGAGTATVSGPGGTQSVSVPAFNGAASVQADIPTNTLCPSDADGTIYLNVSYFGESAQLPLLCKQHVHCSNRYYDIFNEGNAMDGGAYKLKLTNVSNNGNYNNTVALDVLDSKGSVVAQWNPSPIANCSAYSYPYYDLLINSCGAAYSSSVDGIGTINYWLGVSAAGQTPAAQWAEIESCKIGTPSVELVSPADGYPTAQTSVPLAVKYHKGGVTQNPEICNVLIDNNLSGQIQLSDNSQYTYTATSLAAGSHTWKLDCLHVASQNRTFTIQGQTPASVELVYPADGYATKSQNVSFTFRYRRNDLGPSVANCVLMVGGNNSGSLYAADGADNTLLASNLPFGNWSWNISCNGSSSASRRLSIVAVEPPSLELVAPQDNASLNYNNPELIINYSAGDVGPLNGSCVLSLNGTNASNYSDRMAVKAASNRLLNILYQNLSLDTYTWSVSCNANTSYFLQSENRTFNITSLTPRSTSSFGHGYVGGPRTMPTKAGAAPAGGTQTGGSTGSGRSGYSATGGGEVQPRPKASSQSGTAGTQAGAAENETSSESGGVVRIPVPEGRANASGEPPTQKQDLLGALPPVGTKDAVAVGGIITILAAVAVVVFGTLALLMLRMMGRRKKEDFKPVLHAPGAGTPEMPSGPQRPLPVSQPQEPPKTLTPAHLPKNQAEGPKNHVRKHVFEPVRLKAAGKPSVKKKAAQKRTKKG